MKAVATSIVLAMAFASLAHAQSAPSHDQLAERFVRALPPTADKKMDPDHLASFTARGDRLGLRYPAKVDAIHAMFMARAQCTEDGLNAAVNKLMLEAAKTLSDDDLRRLTAFYTGPDYQRLLTVKDGSPEAAALMAQYPLERFGTVYQNYLAAHAAEEVGRVRTDCEATLTGALAKEGIKE